MKHLERKQRSVTIDGHRHGIYLTESEWSALDLIAADRHQKWTDYVTDLVAINPHDAKTNLTGLIRSAVTTALLARSLAEERAQDAAFPQSSLLELSAMFNDRDFVADLKAAKYHADGPDLGGFKVIVGRDQFNRPCIWIENQMRNCPHVAIPLTPGSLDGP